MLRDIILLITAISAITSHRINSESEDWDLEMECTGEIQNDTLLITDHKISHHKKPKKQKKLKIPDSCTSLEIRVENGTKKIKWDKIKKFALPELKKFELYMTKEIFDKTQLRNGKESEPEFEWKSISLFGRDPKEVSRLGIDSYVYMDEDEMLNFNGDDGYLYMSTIDPNLILKEFVGVQLKTVHISDTNFKELKTGSDYSMPKGVTRLILDNVQMQNMSAFIQKFNNLKELQIIHNFDTIDICEIIKQSKYLMSVEITNAVLTCAFEGPTRTTTHQSNEHFKILTLTDCVREKSYNENAWKIMHNLTTLEYLNVEAEMQTVDLRDILMHKQLVKISLTKFKVNFKEDMHMHAHIQQYKSLETLDLTNCDFDLSHFADVGWRKFPNLKYLNVDARASGTKPTQKFLDHVLSRFPNIEHVTLGPFDMTAERKGMFDITFSFDPLSLT